jgi:ATP-binding cassette subfamily B protein
MMRASARLVLLDEPFRGLERARRQELMRRVRARHAGSTLLFVSHDVRDTLSFDRVLVIDGGRVIEDGEPRALFAEASSRYRALADADGQLRRKVFAAGRWRQLRLDDGRLMETERDAQREAAE